MGESVDKADVVSVDADALVEVSVGEVAGAEVSVADGDGAGELVSVGDDGLVVSALAAPADHVNCAAMIATATTSAASLPPRGATRQEPPVMSSSLSPVLSPAGNVSIPQPGRPVEVGRAEAFDLHL